MKRRERKTKEERMPARGKSGEIWRALRQEEDQAAKMLEWSSTSLIIIALVSYP